MPITINEDEPMPITINEDEQDEIEAFKNLATGIADQNKLVLDAIKAVLEQNAQVADAFIKLSETMAGLNIIVNVPEQPAPIVNLTMPEMNMPPAQVTVKMPPEKEKKISMKLIKDREGRTTGIEGTEK